MKNKGSIPSGITAFSVILVVFFIMALFVSLSYGAFKIVNPKGEVISNSVQFKIPYSYEPIFKIINKDHLGNISSFRLFDLFMSEFGNKNFVEIGKTCNEFSFCEIGLSCVEEKCAKKEISEEDRMRYVSELISENNTCLILIKSMGDGTSVVQDDFGTGYYYKYIEGEIKRISYSQSESAYLKYNSAGKLSKVKFVSNSDKESKEYNLAYYLGECLNE